jgi:hypothetical protein
MLVEKPEEKTPLGRPWRRRENDIKMGLMEMGLQGVDWINVDQQRDRWQALVNAVMNLQVL